MSSIVTLSPSFLTTFPYTQPPPHSGSSKILLLKSHSFQPLLASRRTPNFPQGTDNFVDGPRNWSRSITPGFDDDQEVDEDEEDEEEEDRSLDLLVRFVQNVGFSVNGVLILAFFWVLKAFLEVVCTLGSVVFVSILLIRGIWTGVTYMQESRERRTNELVDDQRRWSGAQPAS
ncbi:hypothetical protein CRYUN_Cryun10bG0107000 [Craigia yunnanensis]